MSYGGVQTPIHGSRYTDGEYSSLHFGVDEYLMGVSMDAGIWDRNITVVCKLGFQTNYNYYGPFGTCDNNVCGDVTLPDSYFTYLSGAYGAVLDNLEFHY